MSALVQHNMLVFTKKYGKEMLDALNGSEIYFPLMLAQGSLESGYGTSNAARNKNNFFGVMYNGTTKTFSSPKDAFQRQVKLFYNPNLPYISNGVINATSPYDQARKIADSGYYSLENDNTLPAYMKAKVSKGFTKQDSANWYYGKLKSMIDDALTIIPLGKINEANLVASSNVLTQKSTLV
jgi:uncharacterized FlgJ-related protein